MSATRTSRSSRVLTQGAEVGPAGEGIVVDHQAVDAGRPLGGEQHLDATGPGCCRRCVTALPPDSSRLAASGRRGITLTPSRLPTASARSLTVVMSRSLRPAHGPVRQVARRRTPTPMPRECSFGSVLSSPESGPPESSNAQAGEMTPTAAIPTVTLNDDHTIPVLGLGVAELPPADAEAAVDRRTGGRLPTDRHRRRRRQRGGRRAGDRQVRRAARGAVRHHQAGHRRPGFPILAGRLQSQPGHDSAWTTSTSISSTGRPSRTASTSTPGAGS